METNPSLKLGEVTTVNINVLDGGVQFNVVPSEMTVKVDMRITPTDSHEVLVPEINRENVLPGVCVCNKINVILVYCQRKLKPTSKNGSKVLVKDVPYLLLKKDQDILLLTLIVHGGRPLL